MDEFTRFEKNAWESTSKAYSHSFAHLTEVAIPGIVKALNANPGGLVLDCATGTGKAIQALDPGCHSVGADLSFNMLQEASGRCPAAILCQADAAELPFKNDSFDGIMMGFGLLHLSAPEKTLKEFHRISRPGGQLALTVWDFPNRAKGFEIILQSIEEAKVAPVTLPSGPPFFLYSDTDYAKEQLSAAGFASIKVETLPLIWRLSSFEAFFTGFKDGTARTGALLRAQKPAALERIAEICRGKLESFKTGEGYQVPMPAILYSAQKAA